MPPEQKTELGPSSVAARPEPLDLQSERPEPRRQSSTEGASEQTAIREVREMFAKEKLPFDEQSLPTLTLNKPGYPPFPILIVMLAGTKDLIDILLGIPGDAAGTTVIGLVLTFVVRVFLTAFTLLVSTTIFFWVLGKINRMSRFGIGVGKIMVRSYVKKRIAQGVGGLFIELIFPYFPATTVFVLLAHHHENKYVKLLLSAAEQIGVAYKSGRIKMKG